MTALAPQTADLAAMFAGGAARRMGGADKGAIALDGRPLCQLVAQRLAVQAKGLAVLAPQAPGWLTQIHGARWLGDAPGKKGPAAGLLAALRWLNAREGGEALLLTAPVDAPFLPHDLFEKLESARRKSNAPAAIASHAGDLHPVFGLWRAACAEPVEHAMEADRALYRIAAKAGAVACEAWANVAPDPFTNLNTPKDVAAAEALLRAQRT